MQKLEHPRSEKHLHIILFTLLSVYFIAFCIINFIGFKRFCTPDMYADTIVARMMWEQKTIFPSGWVFGNQYYVVATPVLAALFYGITGSINIAMALATTVMTLLILLSFAWMVKPFVTQTQLLLGILCLVSSIICINAVSTLEGQILYILASYYSCYVITLFVVWGCYVRSLNNKAGDAHKAAYAIAIILSFCTGMQSLRQTAIMVIPLSVFEFLRMSLILVKTHALPEKKDWYVTGKTAAVCLANIAGYILMKLLAIPNVAIYGQLAKLPDAKFAQNAETNLRALRSISGLKYSAGSPVGIFTTVFAVFMIFMVLYYPAMCIIRKKTSGNGLFYYSLLSVLSIICVLVINLFVDISLRSIYLFVWYPLVAFSAVGIAGQKNINLKNALIICICIFSLGNLCISYMPCVQNALSQDNSIEKKVATWVEAKGYKLIYGEWYFITKIAPYTDGSVTAGSWFREPYKVLPYINPLNVYSDADNTTAVYIVRKSERENALHLAADRGAVMTEIASFDDGSCILYTSTIQLMQQGK